MHDLRSPKAPNVTVLSDVRSPWVCSPYRALLFGYEAWSTLYWVKASQDEAGGCFKSKEP